MIGLRYTLGRVHKTGTVEVERVDAKSQAALAGVKPGWKAVKVNGEKVDAGNAQEKTDRTWRIHHLVAPGEFIIQFVCTTCVSSSHFRLHS